MIGTVIFPVWLFQGLEQMRLCAIAFGPARILTVPLLFAFVRQPQHYLRAAAIQASVGIGGCSCWQNLFATRCGGRRLRHLFTSCAVSHHYLCFFGLMSVLGTQTMLVFEMDSLVSSMMLAATCAGLPLTLVLCL